ncbi:MAG: heparan-alpha-glucosaminide N-acetyltransferase [Burkholderiaceae bacterium]|nr:heparan-alpha-glucosaminide N-acetyltransferase [Burkholderiaceae bacterium]
MRATPAAHFPEPSRWGGVDALRGLAMVWMTAYHLFFDLNHFGYIRQNFYTDPFWTWQRTAIVSLFLLCAGMGQAIAVQQAQPWRRFWRRWAQVAGCAMLVTAASYWMYPKSFIYFGVLHGMAVMLLLARLSAGWGAWLWPVGGLAIATPLIAKYVLLTGAGAEFSSYFNAPWLNWLGWITAKPVTEDYVPVFPWLGVMWWGVAVGQWLARRPGRAESRPMPAALRPLAWLGRWSLSYYMVHQPVLIGLLMALAVYAR